MLLEHHQAEPINFDILPFCPFLFQLEISNTARAKTVKLTSYHHKFKMLIPKMNWAVRAFLYSIVLNR